MLAHELRNPLSPIRSAAHLIRLRANGGREDTGLLDACGVIERQVDALSRMVDDLLDVSRVSRGKIHLHPEVLDVAEAVRGAVEVVSPLVASRGLGLCVDLPAEPLRVSADPTRLTQILANLLTNAAKFTPAGGRITVAALRDGEAAMIRVTDTGIGIAPELLPRIFDLFTQGDRSLDRAHGGLGVGLTLVKRLVELHGGTVDARSDGVGRGSELTVRLPLTAADGPVSRSRPEVRARAAKSVRVLVVDDNLDAAEVLADLLRFLGHEVQAAHDGPSALAAARAMEPRVVFLDIGLPGMDGYEVARALRREPFGEHVTIIAVSGYGRESDKALSRRAGCDQHLVKPIDIDAVQRALRWGAAAGRG